MTTGAFSPNPASAQDLSKENLVLLIPGISDAASFEWVGVGSNVAPMT